MWYIYNIMICSISGPFCLETFVWAEVIYPWAEASLIEPISARYVATTQSSDWLESAGLG